MSTCQTDKVAGPAAAPVRRLDAPRLCLIYALLCASIGLLWQYATVHRNYHGNWTALFCVGGLGAYPDLPGEDVYRFANSQGFDGQFYYLIAHDPSPAGGMAAAIDSPDLRYQRILVPFLAYAAALGNPRAIAFSFVAVNLVFLFLGAWWFSKLMLLRGSNPAWGLAFLLVPAVPISLDRMTVDLALVALAAGALYFWETNQPAKMLAVMTLLCLTRDTGLVVVGAFVAFFLIQRQWKRALFGIASAVPFAAWVAYVTALHPPQLRPWTPLHPFAWTLDFLFHGGSYPFSPALSFTVHLLDLVALAGLAVGLAASLLEARHGVLSPNNISNLCFTALAIYLLSLDQWTHVYDFGRVLSPLALNLLLCGVASRRWWLVAPACAMTLRVAVQLAPQFLAIVSPR